LQASANGRLGGIHLRRSRRKTAALNDAHKGLQNGYTIASGIKVFIHTLSV
jgi:hypothetical protein